MSCQKLRISPGGTCAMSLLSLSLSLFLSQVCHICSLAISFVGGTLTIAKGTVAEICIALRSGHLRPALPTPRVAEQNGQCPAAPAPPPGGNLWATGVMGVYLGETSPTYG
ncbi:hypothetical protein BDP55DRAFT_650147 [Colletotrichum godetiae]|uniref:Uncharacterized protein n=1 Tax=Colletotrichum godetiae TaxID=1209918 RepID=A0AAJ0AUZ8_9PEZI|nr:uncharacterized protein BDP55DRAFT_650147 [Colletotrichum godetiae]KAK1690278.1 hypothetical protein BDP55DRAFT_650147 [Colletotrichum godetiae]